MFKIQLEEDVNITVDAGDGDVDLDVVSENKENIEEVKEEITEEMENVFSNIEVANNLIMIHKHMSMFGMSKESLHLLNSNNQLSSALGVNFAHYEDDGELGESNDKVEEIEVPDEAEIDFAMESIGEKVNSIVSKIKSSITNLKEKTKKFFREYLTWAGIWGRKLDAQKTEKFNANIDEAAFENSKKKTFKFANFKHFMETLVSDIKKPIPHFTGKETKFEWCQESMALLGYRIEVYQKDLNYLGERIKDLKAIHINLKEDTTHKIVKEKSSMVNLGWTWRHTKEIFSLIRSSLDPIKKFDKDFDKAIDDLNKFKESIKKDYDRTYTDASVNMLLGPTTRMKSLDEKGKRTLYLYENTYIQYTTMINIYLKIISACMDNVMEYYSIVSKGKIVK